MAWSLALVSSTAKRKKRHAQLVERFPFPLIIVFVNLFGGPLLDLRNDRMKP